MPDNEQQRRQEALGHRLRADRADLTQDLVTRKVDEILAGKETMGQGMISRYEHGKSKPSDAKLRAFAEVYGVDVGTYQRILYPEAFATGEPDLAQVVARLAAQVERLAKKVERLDSTQGVHQ